MTETERWDTLFSVARRDANPQPTETMTTLAEKIRIEANRIARQYIVVLENGGEPATLAAICDLQKYDIMETIADGRANMGETIKKVRIQALSYIKMDLRAAPELAQRLIEFRAARRARDNQAAAAESRNWTPLPAMH